MTLRRQPLVSLSTADLRLVAKYTPVVIELIGAPFDLCGMQRGSRLGPAALRLAHLHSVIQAMGIEVRDRGDVIAPSELPSDPGMRNFGPLFECVQALQSEVAKSLEAGATPLVLGGEHTLAVAGISAALKHFGGELAVLWIDAHADANTPGSSESGNIHGMPLAALWGMPSETEGVSDAEWNRLLNLLGEPRLNPLKTSWYGLRDVDVAERSRLEGHAVTMPDVDRYGVETTVRRLVDWLTSTGATRLWISFDVDALDPILAPGTGTAVRGGLSYREGHLLAELLHEFLAVAGIGLVGMDLVETNPLADRGNETAIMGVEWIASLLGKTVLGSVLR